MAPGERVNGVAEAIDRPYGSDGTPRLGPLIDRVAAIRASVHAKLRAGFLIGAVLLVAMAGVSLAVQGRRAMRVGADNVEARIAAAPGELALCSPAL